MRARLGLELACAIGLVIPAGAPLAQRPERPVRERLEQRSAAAESAGALPLGGRRDLLERRVRQAMWRAARERIGLNDAQLARLAETTQRIDARRRELVQAERAERQALRRELTSGGGDERRVAASLDRLVALQRQRVDLFADEQRELATFISPVQRARYLALQEHVRRRIQQLQRQTSRGARLPEADQPD